MIQRVILYLAILALVVVVAGCVVVQPYQRQTLADPIMQLDFDSMDAEYMNKMLETREGAAGGSSSATSGCGCK